MEKASARDAEFFTFIYNLPQYVPNPTDTMQRWDRLLKILEAWQSGSLLTHGVTRFFGQRAASVLRFLGVKAVGVRGSKEERFWIQEVLTPQAEAGFFVFDAVAAWFADAHTKVPDDVAAIRRIAARSIALETRTVYWDAIRTALQTFNPFLLLSAAPLVLRAKIRMHQAYNRAHRDNDTTLHFRSSLLGSA